MSLDGLGSAQNSMIFTIKFQRNPRASPWYGDVISFYTAESDITILQDAILVPPFLSPHTVLGQKHMSQFKQHALDPVRFSAGEEAEADLY